MDLVVWGFLFSKEKVEIKLKILIVTPFLPYKDAPHAGGVSVFESVRRLSGDHEVHLLSRFEPYEKQHIEDVKRYCKEVYLYPFKTPINRNPIPIILSYITLGLKANRMIKAGTYDMVQVEYTETGFAFRRQKIPSVLVAHDVITKPAMRNYQASQAILQKAINFIKWKAVQFVERFVSMKFDMVLTMSRVDRDILHSIENTLHVEVSPNLLCLDFKDEVDREPESLLFMGAMQRDVNVDAVIFFYQNVLPIIRKERPCIKFYVVGGNPPDALRKMADGDPNLIITGFVKDIREYFFKATLFVSPMLVGGGIIVKNLQAMSCGLPVVTSSIGNEGIEAVPGKDIFIADGAEEFANKVLKLLTDSKLRRRIGDSGKEFAKSRFSDDYLMEIREKLYKKLTAI